MLRANELLAQGFRLAETPDRSLVPEPLVKQELSILGVSVPRSVAIESDCTDPQLRVSHLSSPLVVKAFGPQKEALSNFWEPRKSERISKW